MHRHTVYVLEGANRTCRSLRWPALRGSPEQSSMANGKEPWGDHNRLYNNTSAEKSIPGHFNHFVGGPRGRTPDERCIQVGAEVDIVTQPCRTLTLHPTGTWVQGPYSFSFVHSQIEYSGILGSNTTIKEPLAFIQYSLSVVVNKWLGKYSSSPLKAFSPRCRIVAVNNQAVSFGTCTHIRYCWHIHHALSTNAVQIWRTPEVLA